MVKLYKAFILILILSAVSLTVKAQEYINYANFKTNIVDSRAVDFLNYPNPAVSQITVSYNLNAKSKVNLKVIDLTGRQLAVLINQDQSAGKQEYVWNFSKYKITAGMYILLLRVDDKTYSRKIIVR